MSLPDPTPSSTVLVTGASSGIGAEIARELAARGHGLTVVARREDRLDALADELRRQHGVQIEVHAADLADAARRAELVGVLLNGPLDVVGVVNNAGFGSFGRFAEQELARESEMVRLNVDAVHELTGAFLAPMLDRAAGAILNVASTAGFQPVPNMATYAATKAFVNAFSEALHAELHGSGVSVTSLCPGPSPTEFGEVAGAESTLFSLPGFVYVGAPDVAQAGVDGMLEGRRSVIPGLQNRASALAGRLVPRGLLLAVARRVADRGERPRPAGRGPGPSEG
jgi:short-subunit dehydrogenase